MILDHERLDVYRLALDFLVFANQVIETLPRGRSHLCDQLTRASTSIVLNLAEGAGKHSKADKRRYYLSALGSATESAALLDVLARLTLLDEAGHNAVVVGRSAGPAFRPQERFDLRPLLHRKLDPHHRGCDRSHLGHLEKFPANCLRARIAYGHGHGHAYDPEFRDTP